jgi:hypothetical protein
LPFLHLSGSDSVFEEVGSTVEKQCACALKEEGASQNDKVPGPHGHVDKGRASPMNRELFIRVLALMTCHPSAPLPFALGFDSIVGWETITGPSGLSL